MESAAQEQTAGGDDTSGAGGASTAAARSVLRRLIATRAQDGKTEAPGAPAQTSIERAASVALGRAAEKLHHLPVFVERVEQAPMNVPELTELLPERALLTVLEGSRDELGVMALCPNFLASIIEMQAIGRVTSRPAQSRKPTRTDAAIAADFVNMLLAELGRELGKNPEFPNFASYRYATYIDDPRPLSLMLEDGDMQRLSLHFRVGSGGQRDASIMIAVPAAMARAQLPAGDSVAVAAAGTPTAAPAAAAKSPPVTLSEAVHNAPIQLVGILCRRKVSLHMLRTLEAGSLIPLPQNVLDDARVETPQGQLLARGRLGEANGFHAIRLRPAQAETSDETGAAPHMKFDSGIGDASAGKAPGSIPPAPSAAEPPLDDLGDPDEFRPEAKEQAGTIIGKIAG